jgi:ribosomal protein L11 methyltransferase
MSWHSITLTIDERSIEALSDALLEAGAVSVDVADADAGSAAEKPLFAEPGSAPADSWPLNKVTALFTQNTHVAAVIADALRAAQLPDTTPWNVTTLDDQDWVRATRDQFTPQQITQRLWVVPTWHTPPAPDAINIILDPGLAFGTGTHPTTRLCLRWLDANLGRGDTVIDFGCGSGILAITALKLGARAAWGVDIDEQAVLAARDNALQNQAHATFVTAADQLHAPAQIVVANILANPLTVLAPLLARLTLPGGRVALSGILAEQADEVREVYRVWFDMNPVERDAEWVLLSGVKR